MALVLSIPPSCQHRNHRVWPVLCHRALKHSARLNIKGLSLRSRVCLCLLGRPSSYCPLPSIIDRTSPSPSNSIDLWPGLPFDHVDCSFSFCLAMLIVAFHILGFFGASSLFEHVLCSFLAHLVLEHMFCSILFAKVCMAYAHPFAHQVHLLLCTVCCGCILSSDCSIVPRRPCLFGLSPSASAISRARCHQCSHSALTFCLWVSYPFAVMAILPSILYCFRLYVTCVPFRPFSLYQLSF